MTTAGWRVPINVKLLAILAVPVLGYVVIASAAVLQARDAADEIRDQNSVVDTAVGPTSLVTALIDERTITALERAELNDDLTLRIGSSVEARRATDEQLTALEGLLTEDDVAEAAYGTPTAEVSGGLEALRRDIDSGTADDATMFSRYSTFVDDLLDANAAAVQQVDDADFWQGAMLSELATRQKNSRALLIDALLPVALSEDGIAGPEQAAEIGRQLSIYEDRDAALKELATGPYERAESVLVDALEAADLAALATTTLETGSLQADELFRVASYKGGFVYDAPSGDFIHDNFRANVVEVLAANASSRTADANRALRLHLIFGSVGLVVTAGIAFFVSRSITRPLRSLTQQTIATAMHRLPDTVRDIQETPLGEDVAWPDLEPITVSSSDEVADVAEALNTMQQSALDLAVEEALLRRLVTDSLVTLGQRNADLLGRQLDFITDLERDETDPDILSDLFHLDHLAIRMRRNAESLLVLAGIDPPRTWVGPTSVSVIVRAALGEAEEYKRVKILPVEPATVTGTATAELSHLLAELIENALSFSTRSRTVEVSGRYNSPETGGGAAGGYTISVADTGVGMSTTDLREANRRLTGAESYTDAPSKSMGHYVAGKLAARHGIAVELLSNSPRKGITAVIDIPPHVLTLEEPIEQPTAEMHETAGLRLLDVSAPVAVPSDADLERLGRTAERAAAAAAGGGGGGSSAGGGVGGSGVSGSRVGRAGAVVPRKPRKRKLRPLAASKLPVPPAPDTPLAIQPLENPPDPANSGQAS